MTATNTIASYAFAVWWKDLERWAIPTSILLGQLLPAGWERVRVGTLLRQVTTRVKVDSDNEYKMAGVRWYGEGVFHRETVRGDAMSANQVTPLVAGALIYNRLFAWKASFAVVPLELADCYVSSEFPQFIPDKARILSEYLYLFCTREATIRAVNAASTGSSAVSRNRFKEEEFLNFEISLPPLAEQKAIVARWCKAQDDIASAKARVAAITLEIEHGLLNQIGLEIEPPTSQRGAFALFWGDLERWDTFFYRKDFVALKHSLARISRKKLGDLARFISRTWNHESFPDGFFKYVQISSVSKEDGIFSSKVVGLKKAPSRATTLICKGDLIISTTRPYLGAIAIVPEAYDNHVCSSGFALVDSVDDTHILKEYLLFFLKSQGGLKQMEQRMTGGLYPAITQDELEKIEIPLPPLSVQKQIMERVAAGREEIAREREAADRLARDINAEVEALILGTKKVSEL
ncbi:MAG: restriction endonuclease subunit S [Syntrophales bacterium]|nr:restriction endonuclease subunit S [Syntrophales bacterium]